jgi:chromosome partitioning protein
MIITVINQKGGVAKTTTAQAVGQGLALKGYKVLFIDTDPQGNLSQALGYDTTGKGLYQVFNNKATAKEVIQNTPGGKLIASEVDLSVLDIEIKEIDKANLLKEAIKDIKKDFDFIVIDTQPTLNSLTINALNVADYLIIPLLADIFSLQGLKQLRKTIEVVKKHSNKKLKVLGMVLTRFNNRSRLGQDIKEVLERQAEAFNTTLFKTTIREGIALSEAQTLRANIVAYKGNKNKPGQDYLNLVDEILEALKISK